MTYDYRNMDCMIGMKQYPDAYFDLAIVDPPYGIGESKKTKSRPLTAKQKNGSRLYVSTARKHKISDWDNQRPTHEYFNELFRVSKHQIIWGGNHFADMLPNRSGWIVWDKLNKTSDQSDCELAWTSFKCGVRKYEFLWNGFIQGRADNGKIAQGNKKLNQIRIHPTQKPIQLYKWCLTKFIKIKIKTLLDTNVGSGSSIIGALDVKLPIPIEEFVGFEIDKDYFNDSIKRIKEFESQMVLL